MAKAGKKKIRKNVVKGIAHVKASFNNTQVTITEVASCCQATSCSRKDAIKLSWLTITPLGADVEPEVY